MAVPLVESCEDNDCKCGGKAHQKRGATTCQHSFSAPEPCSDICFLIRIEYKAMVPISIPILASEMTGTAGVMTPARTARRLPVRLRPY